MLCDKFVKDELMNIRITNLIGGNMKNVEDYAQRVAQKAVKEAEQKAEQKDKEIIMNLDKKGFSIEEIIDTINVSRDFVEKTLSK